MDLKSYSRWFDYSRARDEMFAATDTGFAPWFVVRSDDKKRARLNLIRHLLEQSPVRGGAARNRSSCPSGRSRTGIARRIIPTSTSRSVLEQGSATPGIRPTRGVRRFAVGLLERRHAPAHDGTVELRLLRDVGGRRVE